jgi:hypothetical protein
VYQGGRVQHVTTYIRDGVSFAWDSSTDTQVTLNKSQNVVTILFRHGHELQRPSDLPPDLRTDEHRDYLRARARVADAARAEQYLFAQ